MQHRIIATAIALLLGLSIPRGVAAKGHGAGHSGGGHSVGGHTSGGHSTGGHAGSVHAGGGHASGGRSPAAPHAAAPPPPVATSPTRGFSRPPDGHAVVGTAVPRSSGPRDVFVVTPSVYAPHFFRPRFAGLGFGIRHLGYGYGPAYYGLGYGQPLLCETTIDCDFVPVTGAVDVPQYEAALPEVGSGSVRLEVQPAFAQIFVDGEYVGTVEDFHSATGLMIRAGVHRLEFRAPGYEPLVVDVRIAPHEAMTYRGALESTRPAAPEREGRTPAASTAPMYVIPNCYLGNVPPRPQRLPPGCDIKQVQVLGSK